MNIENQGKKSLKQWIIEIAHIIKVFVVPYKGIDEIKDVPNSVKIVRRKCEIISFLLVLIMLIFSFFLKVTNLLIQAKFVILGILVFMLYKGSGLVEQIFRNYIDIERENSSQIFDDEIFEYGANILGNAIDKVYKYNTNNNISTVMPNEDLINCIENYLKEFWNYQVQHVFDVIKLFSICVMLIVVFITNDDIPNRLFVPFVLAFSIITFIVTAYRVKSRRECYNNNRKVYNERSALINDLMRVKPIVSADLQMRISRFQRASGKIRKNNRNLTSKLNKSEIIDLAIQLFFQYTVIFFYIWQIKWNNITLASIAEIGANLAVLMAALSYIRELARNFNNNAEAISVMDSEATDLKQIMNVFKEEIKKVEFDKPVTEIHLKPFSVQYEKKDENDIPFVLESPEDMIFKVGDVIFFVGASGSGKSTVFNMVMDKVRIGKSVDIPNTTRFSYFDETLQFGSLSIYDEFFADCDVNIEKAFKLFEDLHLSEELKFSKDTVERWMRTHYYKSSMSHGQKQRMILSKILYHLNENIDVVILDEVSSGLDDSSDEGMDAQTLLEYCIRYVNSDKKRITLISTHQSFDVCRQKLEAEDNYSFKVFEFKRSETSSMVRQKE